MGVCEPRIESIVQFKRGGSWEWVGIGRGVNQKLKVLYNL